MKVHKDCRNFVYINLISMSSEANEVLAFFKTQIGKDDMQSPSPVGNWLKGKLVAVEEGSLKVVYTVRPEMTNPAGTLHGGIVSAMMDDVMGATVFATSGGSFYNTINLVVDFFAHSKPGEEVTLTTQVTRLGRRMTHISADLHNAEGRLLARGTSNLIKSEGFSGK